MNLRRYMVINSNKQRPAGIHRGQNTHHQDQLIHPKALRSTKTNVKIIGQVKLIVNPLDSLIIYTLLIYIYDIPHIIYLDLS